MENQQSELLQNVFDTITKISNAYETIGLGPFTDEVYQEIISIDIKSIEFRFKQLNESNVPNGSNRNSISYGVPLHNQSATFDKFSSLIPPFREYIATFPVQLIKIVNGLPVTLTDSEQDTFFANQA